MRILHVIDSLDVGGAEKMCVQLANQFVFYGHDVGILYFRRTAESLVADVNPKISTFYWPKRLCSPFFYKEVAKVANDYDIIHVHLKSTLKIFYVTDFIFSIRAKVVFHDHTGSKKIFDETAKDLIIKKALVKYPYVAVHNDLKVMTADLLRGKNKFMAVISNFIIQPNEVKIQLKTKDNKALDILILGNIKDQKNQHFLVPLAQGLIAKGYTVCFHICGKIQDAQYHQILLNNIESSKLQHCFKFYHQFNNFDEIPLSIDLALMVSKDESGPLVNIEYLLMKVPFLTHGVGDVSIIIKKYLPHQVIYNLDTSLWVDKILELYSVGAGIKVYNSIYQSHFSNNMAYHHWLQTYHKL